MQKPSQRHKLTSDNNIIQFKKPVQDPLKIIWAKKLMNLPCCHCHVTVSRVASLPNPLPWPHGIVKCSLNAHFPDSSSVFPDPAHSGTFCWLFLWLLFGHVLLSHRLLFFICKYYVYVIIHNYTLYLVFAYYIVCEYSQILPQLWWRMQMKETRPIQMIKWSDAFDTTVLTLQEATWQQVWYRNPSWLMRWNQGN